MRRGENTTSKSFIILTAIALFEKALSFVFQALIAGFMGTTSVTDSYFSANEFMTLVDATLFNGLIIALLNQYTYKVKKEGKDNALKLLSENNIWLLLLSLITTGFIFGLAEPLSYILAPGFDEEARNLLVRDLRIISFVPIFIALSSGFIVVLRQRKDFLIAGLKSLFISLTGMGVLFVIIFVKTPFVVSLSLGQLLAAILYFAVSWVGSRRYEPVKLFGRPRWGEDQKSILKMWLPLIVSNGITRVALMVDRVIASNLAEGSVSCLTYAHTLYNFVHGILVLNLCLILLSDFTNLAAENRVEELKARMVKALTIVIYALLVITILILFYSSEVVSIVFERGNFTADAVVNTGELLFFYGICLIPSAINNIYIQMHYAYGKTAKTMIFSLISIGINILGSLTLTKFFGLPGVAVGTVIATVIMSILYFVSIRKLVPGYKGLINLGFIRNALLLSCGCVAATFAVKFLIKQKIVSFVVATVVAAAVAVAVLLLLKDKEILGIKEAVSRKFSRNKGL